MGSERVTTEQAQGWIEAYERTGNGNAVPARIAKDLLDARAQVEALTGERDTALTRIAALEAEVARLAPAPVEDTGDCRTCASHDTAGFCAKPTAFTRVWFNRHICDDDMTRRPGSPPCPGFARKET